jgi:hypothetical protein
VFDQMERDSSRGCYLGELAGVAAPWTDLLEDKQFREGRTLMSLSK